MTYRTTKTIRATPAPIASDFDVLDAVKALAEKRGVTLAQIALAWIVRQPSVTAPIVGVSKPEQLDQLVAALDIEQEKIMQTT